MTITINGMFNIDIVSCTINNNIIMGLRLSIQ